MSKYAVLIGNSQFPEEADKNKLPDLACPEQDVDGLATFLSSERGEFIVLPLKNKPSTQIKRELQRTVNKALQDDLLLFYYSGHGKPNKAGILHLTTYDTVISELETSSIPINHIYDILGTGKCKKIIIILDCCYSGAAGQGFKGAVEDQLKQLNRNRGTYLVTASTELQVAHESAVDGLSLFTKHLIAGLDTGDADKNGDGWVDMNELYDYVESKVMAENPAQQPTKHVKEERGGLFITKSGRDSKTERLKKIKNYFHDLAKEDRITGDILIGVLELLKRSQSEISLFEQLQYALVIELFENKIMAIEFVRKWDKLAFEIEKAEQEKAIQQRLARDKEAQDKTAIEKAEQEKAKQEQLARDKEAQDKAASEKAEQEKIKQEQLARDKEAQDKVASEKAEQEKAIQEQLARDKEVQDKVARKQAEQEKAKQAQLARDKEAQDKAAKEQVEQEKATQAQLARDKEAQAKALKAKQPKQWKKTLVWMLFIVAIPSVVFFVNSYQEQQSYALAVEYKKQQQEAEAKAESEKQRQETEAKRQAAAESQKYKIIEPEMIAINAGCFLMGSLVIEAERNSDEKQHKVCVEAFSLGKTEVTFADYNVFANATGQALLPNDEGWGHEQRPVIHVSWHDAMAYIAWLNQQTGKNYRLPTEAEWEYAARAGTTTPFYTGECLSSTQANYNGNFPYNNCAKGVDKQQTVTVGSYPPNAWGLSDMAGNVSEWTCSAYVENYDGSEKQCASKNDASTSRVLRDGSWAGNAGNARSAARSRSTPDDRGFGILGFRLALGQQPK